MQRMKSRVVGFVGFLILVAVACVSSDSSPTTDRTTSNSLDTSSPAERERKPRNFSLVASGDILVHSPVASAALAYGGNTYDFRPMFAPIRPLVRAADLAICHLETPVSRDNTDLSYYPVFNTPREIVTALDYAGYDYCSTASNHALDASSAGIEATLDALDRAGIEHDGTARSPRESARPAEVEVGGNRVALLSYTYGLNGFSLPSDMPWAVNLIDGDQIVADAQQARRRGADFVVVSLHWGAEYVHEPTEDQRTLARKLAGSKAVDLILGHHAHVVQPVARVKGRHVVYGMGNFLSNQSSDCCPVAAQDGVIVHIRVREIRGRLRVARVLYSPTWVDRGSYRILPVKRALRDPDTPDVLSRDLRKSFSRTRSEIEALGTHAVRSNAHGFVRATPED
jgi:poly-gamma-glutamate capsule biosynthesis protein CapA/YwtB (metallophosphatase superfamily)